MKRKPDSEPGTFPGLALQVKPAPMSLGQFASDAEPQPHALWKAFSLPSPNEGLKHGSLNVLWDSRTGVTDPDPDLAAVLSSFYQDLSPGW